MSSIALSSEEFDQWCEQALVLQQAGNLDAAQAMYRELLLLDPTNSGVMVNFAATYSARGQQAEALLLLEQSLVINPREAYAHCALGHAYVAMKRYEESLTAYTRAIELQPNVALFWDSRGVAFSALQRLEEALVDHDRALTLDPNYAEIYNNRGNVLARLKRQAEALASYAKACALLPGQPIFWCNRGAMLHFFRRDAEALACYDQAIALYPQYVDAHINRGTLLGDMRRVDEAIASFDRAIALQMDATEAYWNKALVLLTHGNFAAGWRLHEWRWEKPAFKAEKRAYAQPLWLGETPIAGQTILIHPEQGFGDYIQFARYARTLEAQGAKVVLEVPSPLATLLSTLSPTIQIVEKGKPLPAFDVHIPLMSLAYALRTTTETIPESKGYLSVDATRGTEWAKKLGAKTKPRIGIAWSGAVGHVNDHNRSMVLAEFKPLWGLPYDFYSLQKEIRTQDLPELHYLQCPLEVAHDFTDTAALIDAMDLVISVDTAVAHAAGALGKKTWLLLPCVPDFRWLLDREDTPWYESMRLFRQPTPGDWASVIARVKDALHD